jgi:hypothetical protein
LTVNFLAAVIRAVAKSPCSLTRSRTRPCRKMAHGSSCRPSLSHSPASLSLGSGLGAAPAGPPKRNSPPAAAAAFSAPRLVAHPSPPSTKASMRGFLPRVLRVFGVNP